jgi:hypothetical protein
VTQGHVATCHPSADKARGRLVKSSIKATAATSVETVRNIVTHALGGVNAGTLVNELPHQKSLAQTVPLFNNKFQFSKFRQKNL